MILKLFFCLFFFLILNLFFTVDSGTGVPRHPPLQPPRAPQASQTLSPRPLSPGGTPHPAPVHAHPRRARGRDSRQASGQAPQSPRPPRVGGSARSPRPRPCSPACAPRLREGGWTLGQQTGPGLTGSGFLRPPRGRDFHGTTRARAHAASAGHAVGGGARGAGRAGGELHAGPAG